MKQGVIATVTCSVEYKLVNTNQGNYVNIRNNCLIWFQLIQSCALTDSLDSEGGLCRPQIYRNTDKYSEKNNPAVMIFCSQTTSVWVYCTSLLNSITQTAARVMCVARSPPQIPCPLPAPAGSPACWRVSGSNEPSPGFHPICIPPNCFC